MALFSGKPLSWTKRRPGTRSARLKQPLHVVTRGEHSGLNTDGSYVDIAAPAYSFGEMLCCTLTRSLRAAGAYRPNDFMVFRYQLLAIANECIQTALVSVIFTAGGVDLPTTAFGSGRVPHVRPSVHGPKTIFSNAFIASTGVLALGRSRFDRPSGASDGAAR